MECSEVSGLRLNAEAKPDTAKKRGLCESELLECMNPQAYKLGPDEPAQYALEGSIAIAGAGVSWLRDSLQIISSPEDSEAVASSVDSTGGK